MERILEGPATFYIFGLLISETVINTWIVMALLIGFALIARRRLEMYPGKFQNFVELIIESITNLVTSTMGEERKGFAPYMGTLFLFLAVANMSGIIGLRPPTADINLTAALALLTFSAIHYYGLKKKGFGHIKGLAEPLFLFLPLNIIGELAKPVSLSMRLFGNIFGGAVIMAMIAGAVGIFVPVLPSLYFDLFAGVLQSFIFVMLTMVFITLALE
jgi:F-type H+-transporting ATPase subunit a